MTAYLTCDAPKCRSKTALKADGRDFKRPAAVNWVDVIYGGRHYNFCSDKCVKKWQPTDPKRTAPKKNATPKKKATVKS